MFYFQYNKISYVKSFCSPKCNLSLKACSKVTQIEALQKDKNLIFAAPKVVVKSEVLCSKYLNYHFIFLKI
jgi:hypothetical protein